MPEHPASWSESPDVAREHWHTEARQRDEAYVATLPDDDSEYREPPQHFGEMESRPAPESEVNWELLQNLSTKPHKHLNIVEGEQYGLLIDGKFEDCCNGVGEVMQEARTVQHLCDLAGIPEGHGYDAHIDARVYLLLAQVIRLRERIDRIVAWHSRETGPGGMVADDCNECGQHWPCDTRRMAEGTYEDSDDHPID